MTTRRTLIIALAVYGCGPTAVDKSDNGVPKDVSDALGQLPDAQVLTWTDDGLPTYIVGELARVGAMQTDDPTAADNALRGSLPPVLATMRLHASDLMLRRFATDDAGNRHFRYETVHNGLDVIGGEIVVGVDVKGAIYQINGAGRGDISAELGSHAITQSAATNRVSTDSRFINMAVGSARLVYIETDDGAMHQAYETLVQGMRDGAPVRDRVYVDVDTQEIVADYPQIFLAESRKVYNLNHGTSLPGTLVRSEGGAASTDTAVNGAYDGTGNTWTAYHNFFNRDSWNNAGGALISSVHYSSNYCNAYWDGSQMVYGDGDPAQNCSNLAVAQDVTAHELTHGVTQSESGLNYSGESGGMNEAMSDIFGSWVEAWRDGGKTGTTLSVSANTWLIGEEVIPPALRWMCDPQHDGQSADIYSSSVGNLDVHYSSGLGNLAFCLLSQGGPHPRGKTSITTTGIGMDKAIRIMYEAQTNILTSTAKFANVRTAMEQAATNLGYDQATKDAVGCAWAEIGVGTAPASCGGGGGDGTLMNGVAVTGISGATSSQQFWKLDVPAGQTSLTFTISGGTGDADMYVQSGSKPTLTAYACRPYVTGNAETCSFTPPAAGTYWVMLNGYAAYTGVKLVGTYSSGGGGGGDGVTVLTNGAAVTGIAGATSSNAYWKVQTPAGASLTVKISGGTGDADLYTKFAVKPTTSSYDCRPYLNGNSESCKVTSTQAGYYYVMLRGYQTYSGVSLVASW